MNVRQKILFDISSHNLIVKYLNHCEPRTRMKQADLVGAFSDIVHSRTATLTMSLFQAEEILTVLLYFQI